MSWGVNSAIFAVVDPSKTAATRKLVVHMMIH